jgi:recombination protein RecR
MNPIERLIIELSKLPGIGRKSAERLAYHIARSNEQDAKALGSAVLDVKERVRFCAECCNLAEGRLCRICSAPGRDRSVICVVEEPQDLEAIERSASFNGLYHVLHGAISPLDGVGPDDIKAQELLNRLKKGGVAELIVATNPTTAGEATAIYLAKTVKPFVPRVTRIAFGIPFGGDIEYADISTLARSISSRSNISV